MSQPDENKVYYSSEGSLPADVDILPADAKCGLCQCYPRAHAMYWKCPLLDTFICSECCQTEVPDEANLPTVNLRLDGERTFTEVTSVCGTCKRNSLS